MFIHQTTWNCDSEACKGFGSIYGKWRNDFLMNSRIGARRAADLDTQLQRQEHVHLARVEIEREIREH